MRKNYNLIRRLTDERRKTKDGKTALAVYLGIKLYDSNSIHSGATPKEIKDFFRCGYNKAKDVLRIVNEDTELFSLNEKKNVIFAKSCKSKEKKLTTGKIRNEYLGDDVIKVHIPECYLNKSGTLSLKELLLLVDYVLIQKEYDEGKGYKLHEGTERSSHCETEPKSQSYVSEKTGIKRTTLQRRLKYLTERGIIKKVSEKHLERCKPDDKGAFKAFNKLTRLPYYLKAVAVTYSLATASCSFTHVIWDSPKRVLAQQMKSDERMKKDIMATSEGFLTDDEVNFRLVVMRELERRELYD